jgi:DNA polymerase I
VRDPRRDEEQPTASDRAEVIEKFGVGPERVVDVQALAGDSVDNIPGAPGIGIKTAAQLINEFGDLDNIAGARGRDQAAQAARDADRTPTRSACRANWSRCGRWHAGRVTLDDLEIRLPDPAALLGFLRRWSSAP